MQRCAREQLLIRHSTLTPRAQRAAREKKDRADLLRFFSLILLAMTGLCVRPRSASCETPLLTSRACSILVVALAGWYAAVRSPPVRKAMPTRLTSLPRAVVLDTDGHRPAHALHHRAIPRGARRLLPPCRAGGRSGQGCHQLDQGQAGTLRRARLRDTGHDSGGMGMIMLQNAEDWGLMMRV